MGDLYLALLHYPVVDKNGLIVTSAVTNMDVHDIARSARTYGAREFYVATPVKTLHALVAKIMEHWETGFGSTYNETRKDALGLVRLANDLDDVIVAIEHGAGVRPVVVVTSARPGPKRISFATLRHRLETTSEPRLLVFGTGWGLAPSIIARADEILEPVVGPSDYNHLSVRSAAAVILDRLRAPR
ncbi:MAG TPA: RNA methyltransferase [Candidatus Binatia bacterium]|nr:RNA methyltransferase [Candidatus Binatia bacterium]